MNYVYGIMFIICGLILLFKLRSENKVFIPLGIYFVLLGGLRLVQTAVPSASNVLNWVMRVMSAVALVICFVFYYKNSQVRKAENAEKQKQAATKKSKDDSGLF